MVNNAIEKRVGIHVESTFGAETQFDFDTLIAPEGLLAVTEAQTENLVRAYIDNKNIAVRAPDVHAKIRGLRSAAMSQIGSYLYGARSGHAAAGAAATRDLLDVVLQSILGGEHTGFSADLVGGSAAAPEVDVGDGVNHPAWTWGYFWDANGGELGTGQGYFRMIASVVGDVLTMAPGHTLPFTPVAGDRLYAVRQHYPSWPAMEDPTHADHNTLDVLIAGAHAEDFFELKGVKPDLQFGPIEQGTPAEIMLPLKLAYFYHHELTLPKPDLAYALQGSPGTVVGAGTRTTCWLSAAETLLATQQFWGAIQPSVAIEHAAITGPNGIEGVHGWGLAEASYKAGGVDLAVPFDRDWKTAAEAGTEYHLLVQVGNAITDGVWGLYFPRLTFNEDAKPAEDDNRRRQSSLSFLARERQDPALLALAETVRERSLAKFQILRIG